ncbi:hypothetical protein K435DRAFT_822181 [Dendrothele bispora CBS 962.96]|uniref:Clr5 domain-containing protein n=1 Tax=Dendrothele bispora (strain CBS 962.96) TaxID=1314807 RepID=A0A4S8LC57_DENBC|nr:hypothetical protein K435DRAFT_822181 [Dendrothele bispora CBS 962.96]
MSEPNDEVLKNALLEYSEEALTAKETMARLEAQFGYSIKRSTLFTLQKKFDIPTARKNAKKLSDEAQTSLVLDKIDNDLYKQNGPNVILNILARDHTPLPRRKVREVMKEEYPEGALLRRPGNHNKIPRKKLEIHADGHEKLSAQALDMGGVGIPIYGFRQKVGYLQKYNVIPNARSTDVVGHLYLDMIVEAGYR